MECAFDPLPFGICFELRELSCFGSAANILGSAGKSKGIMCRESRSSPSGSGGFIGSHRDLFFVLSKRMSMLRCGFCGSDVDVVVEAVEEKDWSARS